MQIRRLIFSLVLLICVAGAAPAAEIVVQNDSTVGGVPSTSYPNFLVGESVAAWLTSPCDGDITAVQVYWASQVGGASAQIEDSITLFNSGTYPSPGPVMLDTNAASAVIVAPSLADQVMNEYRHLDPPTNGVPLRVPVSSGQTFVASLKFFNQSSGGSIFTPAPTADQDGCQATTNAVDVIPGGWADACAAGVTGDWVIRAKIQCKFVPTVPSVNQWGLALLLGLLLASGVAILSLRRAA